jgi:Beta-Casp domain
MPMLTTAATCPSWSRTALWVRSIAPRPPGTSVPSCSPTARLQEEEAAYANTHGYAKHQPALPLYTQADAEEALQYCVPVAFDVDADLGDGLSFRLSRAGHILGAACGSLRDAKSSSLFSGDLGRPHDPIMLAPAVVRTADYLVIESTYGDRRHDPTDPQVALAEIINRTVARGGVIVVPAFAVGRAQTMLSYLQRLKAAAAASPNIPVFLNSPMAVNATRLLCKHQGEPRLTPEQCEAVCGVAHMVTSGEESKALNRRQGPIIIIAAGPSCSSPCPSCGVSGRWAVWGASEATAPLRACFSCSGTMPSPRISALWGSSSPWRWGAITSMCSPGPWRIAPTPCSGRMSA